MCYQSGFGICDICGENDCECEECEELVITVPECDVCGSLLVSNAMRINFCPNCELKT